MVTDLWMWGAELTVHAGLVTEEDVRKAYTDFLNLWNTDQDTPWLRPASVDIGSGAENQASATVRALMPTIPRQ